MKRAPLTLTLLAAALAGPSTTALASRPDDRGGPSATEPSTACRTVRAVSFTWRDEARCRTVPATIYYPEGDETGLPVILFSHGLGRSRHACGYLGRYWAAAGYVSVHVEHYGSNEAVWRGTLRARQSLRAAFYSQASRRNRPQDLSFAIDRLAELQAAGDPLAARLDLGRIGVSGHDFGAQTSLVLAGEMLPGYPSYADPRIRAAVAMSTPIPEGAAPLSEVFGGVRAPCLHITGTRDDSLVGTTRAAQRRLPFDNIWQSDQYLLTFYGADHLIYAGHPLAIRNRSRNDGAYQQRLRRVTTLFWDAYLKEDPRAREAMAHGGLAAAAGNLGRVEQKSGSGSVAAK